MPGRVFGAWPRLSPAGAGRRDEPSSIRGWQRTKACGRCYTTCRSYQQARAQHIDSAGRWYELYYDYPEDERDFLSTRLGNVLRAAERHAYYRFGLDTIIMWPRLVHVAPQQFLLDVDEARASLEFLLVLSLWFYTFGLLDLLILITTAAPTWLALCCFLTGTLGGYRAYISSLGAAREYGEQLRAGSELYRHDVLQKYKIEVPPSVAEEKRTWVHLREFLGNARDDRSWTYVQTGVPEVIVHLDPVASRRGVSRRNRQR